MAVPFLDGQPINVKLAVNAIREYGLDLFLADPSLLVEWKRRRAEDFLKRITFGSAEQELMAVLAEYRFLNFELLKFVMSDHSIELFSALRNLENFCCIERKDSLYNMSPPLRDAVGRDARFSRSNEWKKALAEKILAAISDYRNEDDAPLSLLEAGAKAVIVDGTPQGLISHFVLPSHFIALARNAYDQDRRKQSLQLSKMAFENRSRLSVDGQIEALRLWGLSAIRLGEEPELDAALRYLEAFKSIKIARQHAFFLRGFKLRLKKKFEQAEQEFLNAHKLAPRNFSINRELANLYRHRREYVEAESYARAAYTIAPTNPYILDVLLETLLGKSGELKVDAAEVEHLFGELRTYGDVPGSSFYQVRKAQDLLKRGDKPGALAAIDLALKRTPEFLPCHVMKADIAISMRNLQVAREHLSKMDKILEKRGGFSEEDEGRLVDLEVRLLIEEHRFKEAREKLQRSQFLPSTVQNRLSRFLARAVAHEPARADKDSRAWADAFLRPGPKS